MRGMLHLLLLLFAVTASVPVVACPPPQPATHAHGDHHGQPRHDPEQALTGHLCVGCAAPLREIAPIVPAEIDAALHPPVTVAPLPGQRLALEPPPPKILA